MKISHVEKTYHDIKTPFEIAEGMKKDRFKNDFGYCEDTSKHMIVESALLCMPMPLIGGIQDCDGCIEFIKNSMVPGALVAFMENKFPLVGMQVLTDAEGLFYDDLMGIYRNRIDDCKLYIHYVSCKANDGIVQDMFFNSLVGNFSCD